MGRRSTKEKKNIYQQSRENVGLTREAASDLMKYISADRIEKMESGKSAPHPDEILAMAECYKNPMLCNYYCTHECPIGEIHVAEVREKSLSEVTLEMLAMLNSLVKEKERLIEITVDGRISDDEIRDFVSIRDKLEQMSAAVESLKLWVENAIVSGELDRDTLEKA